MADESREAMWGRWPMAPAALASIAGIVTGGFVTAPPALLFTVAVTAAAACLLWERRRVPLLLLGLFLAGWTNVAVRQAVLAPHDLRHLTGDAPHLVTVRGCVAQPPATRVSEREGEQLWRTLVIVRVMALRRGGEWEPAAGDVAVTTAGDLSGDVFAGLSVEVTGVLRPPPGALAPGLFDYRAHLARQGIYRHLAAGSRDDWQILLPAAHGRPAGWGERFQNWARATLARGLPEEDEPLRLLWAMALGWRTALTNEVSEPFMRSGTMHLFAISGLHVAMIAGILVGLLRLARMPRGGCGLVAIPLLWFYTAATGWQPSAIRSTIMAGVVIAGWALKRPSDLVNSLAAAAFIVLLWQPQQLFMAGFQLSFAVVLSIGLLLPRFERVRARLFQPDPLLPPELRPRWQRWLDWPVRFLTANFATSLAAWLGSLPLVAHYFHLVTPVSLLANLLIVPLSGLALMSCFGSLVFGAWAPPVSETFNHGAWFWMWLMQRLGEWCAGLPGAWLPAPPPTPAVFALYYTALAAVVTGAVFRREHWKWVFPAVAIPALAAGAQWLHEQGNTRLHVLGLRGGEAVFLDAPGRSGDWLIDCATDSDAPFALEPFLRRHGHRRLPNLALTHGDLRHVGGFPSVEEKFRPETVWTSGLRFRSPAYRRAVQILQQTPERWRQVHRGDRAGPWEVLHPAAGARPAQADDGALVLRGEFRGVRVLLLSDLGRDGQAALLASGQDLRADIVVAGTPAQDEPLRADLLDAVQPRLIIISAGEFPAGERPSAELRRRLAAWRAPVICTLDAGTVTMRFREGTCEVRTMGGRTYALAGAGAD